MEIPGAKGFSVLGPFVAAMYKVTKEEIDIALAECHHPYDASFLGVVKCSRSCVWYVSNLLGINLSDPDYRQASLFLASGFLNRTSSLPRALLLFPYFVVSFVESINPRVLCCMNLRILLKFMPW